MRTLIISDLHLGTRIRHDVLRRPAALERLLAGLEGIDRLVLLGDAVELMEGRAQRALAIAEPVLRAIGARLGAGAEVILVPGNHDLPLVRAWVRGNLSRLQPDTRVPADASPALARVCGWLSPARTEVRYPGVWLSPRVWATHGHYVDLHLFPRSSYGISRGLLGGLPRTPTSPAAYERGRRASATAVSRWLPRSLATVVEDAADLLRAAMTPQVRRRLLNPRIAPLTSSLLALQLRWAGVPTLAHIADRLGVDADWLVFGHVHRLGPLADDEPAQWRGPGGRPEILNTGSWLYEPLLVHRATPSHPYWPGGAVLLEDGEHPRAIGLLDDFGPGELR